MFQFKTILVATDLSKTGSSALRYAQGIAVLHKSVLVVVHVIDPVSYAFPEGTSDFAAANQAARDELHKIEEESRRQGIPIRSVTETGMVYEGILQAALDHRADLLVVGTRAKTGIGGAALGTVARRLLARATYPVLAIPPDSNARLPWAGRWRHVLVATDFSPASLSALRHAQRIASELLVVLHVPHDAIEDERDRCLEQLRILAPFDESHTVPVERIVRPGEVGKVIVENARNCDADLVVLGSPVNELTDEELHTSTVLQVISEVNCPVLCVPSLQASVAPALMKEVTSYSQKQTGNGRRGQAGLEQGNRGPEAYHDHGSYTADDRSRQCLSIEIPADHAVLHGDLHIPVGLNGVVVFAHGSGSSRHSPRNQFVAQALQQAGMATLLLDLLTEEEEARERQGAELRFDIGLLARRLQQAIPWIAQQRELDRLKIGLFGASTGAAAALAVASEAPEVAAVVSRGGRPDLAGAALERVRVPVLLIVGGEDHTVLNLNRRAMTKLGGEKQLQVVPGATHLFEEPGALEKVADLARQWFERRLGRLSAAMRAA